MLQSVFQKLDAWLIAENKVRSQEGALRLPRTEIRIVGQTGLVEAHVDLELIETMDVDALGILDHLIQKKFDDLLRPYGKRFDPLSHEVWMPKETEYDRVFDGRFVRGLIARPEYILVSKAMKAPKKNFALIQEYLAKGPSETFLFLAKKYALDLEEFL